MEELIKCCQYFHFHTEPDTNEEDESYEERNRKEEKRQRDTVIIAGSLVSTVSFIFVIFWVTYCCWKRQYLTEPRSARSPTIPGSATSSSTPKSDGNNKLFTNYVCRVTVHFVTFATSYNIVVS